MRITDIITSRLPKTAATIIDIINDALNMVNRNSNQSDSLSMFGLVVVGIVDTAASTDAAAAAAAAATSAVAAEAKSSVVVADDDNDVGVLVALLMAASSA